MNISKGICKQVPFLYVAKHHPDQIIHLHFVQYVDFFLDAKIPIALCFFQRYTVFMERLESFPKLKNPNFGNK